jgi:hypothetical protein
VPATHEILPAQLVIRSSCGAARKMMEAGGAS